MKLGIGLALIPWVAMLWPAPSSPVQVIVSGNWNGKLSPCGCTKPMQGGIRRWATLVRAVGEPSKVALLSVGTLSRGTGPQATFKLETLAELLGELEVDALALSREDKAVAPEAAETVARFVGKGLLADSQTTTVNGMRVSASATAKPDVLLFDGPREEAVKLAEQGAAKVILFRSDDKPLTEPLRVGKSWLLSPGFEGKHFVSFAWDGKRLTDYTVRPLGPEVADDKLAASFFQTYQIRVDRASLIEAMPRVKTDPFAGTKTCGSCHSHALEVWEKSRHAHALNTLEKDGHARDPDCLGCHVVGLESMEGFRTRDKTPDLTDVGCESCHGPGLPHAKTPMEVRMPRVEPKGCITCHDPNNSPNFNYETYWKRIQH